MTFNIREIQSAVNRSNGIYRPSHFRVLMPTRQVGDQFVDMRILSLHANAITAPGLNLLTSDINHRGYGIIEKRPYQAQSNDVNVSFRIDGNFDIPNFFYRWMKRISSFDGTVYGINDSDLFDYPDSYVTDFDIEQFDTSGEMINIHTLTRAYPISVDTIQLDWSLQNQISQFTVQFSFHTWTTVMLEE